jgi:hypothetical protein
MVGNFSLSPPTPEERAEGRVTANRRLTQSRVNDMNDMALPGVHFRFNRKTIFADAKSRLFRVRLRERS